MSVHPESIRLTLVRLADDSWQLLGAKRNLEYGALVDADDVLPEAGVLSADSPGALLEAIGQRLDVREAHRLTVARGFDLTVEPGAGVQPSPADLDDELERDDRDLDDEVRRLAQDDPRGEADR